MARSRPPIPLQPIAVFDTSVLFPERMRKNLLEAARLRLCYGVWNPWIISELFRTLTVRWLQHAHASGGLETSHDFVRQQEAMSRASARMMRRMIALLRCHDTPTGALSWPGADPDDDPILALALAVHAEYIVSENASDFPPQNTDGEHVFEGIRYVRADEFLARIGLR